MEPPYYHKKKEHDSADMWFLIIEKTSKRNFAEKRNSNDQIHYKVSNSFWKAQRAIDAQIT